MQVQTLSLGLLPCDTWAQPHPHRVWEVEGGGAGGWRAGAWDDAVAGRGSRGWHPMGRGPLLADPRSFCRVFGFMAWKQGSTTDNVCHLFAEHDP